MQFVKLTLVFFFIGAAYAEESDAAPALNPLDVPSVAREPELKSWRDIGKGVCAVYEFARNASVTSDEVADFILSETPVKYRSALYDEFVKGGAEFVSRLANVGCHMLKIKSWFLNHFHRSNNADTMATLEKPFAGLKDSADVAIIHFAMEYIHERRSSGEDLHLIPETLCQVRDLSTETRVSLKRIVKTAENLPEPIRVLFVARVLQLRGVGVEQITLLASVGCQVLPAVVDVDVKNMPEEEAETAVAIVPEKKLVASSVLVGVCAVYDIATKANVTHEEVAEFILKKTPQKYRSALYEEFVKGGTTFLARIAKVGCSMVKVRTLLTSLSPFHRLIHVLKTVSKPFGGLVHSEDFKLLHDYIEYIDNHREDKGMMVVADTMCFVRQAARDRRITKQAVIAEVEKKMPAALRKSLVDKIFRFGVNSVANVADVACKTLPVHVEVDVSSIEVTEETAVANVVTASADVQPAAFPFVPFFVGSRAFCELHRQLQQRGVTHEKVIATINRVIPRPLRQPMIERLTRDGIEKLAVAARVGCTLVPRLMKEEVFDNEIVTASLETDVSDLKEKFCNLLYKGNQRGVTKSDVSQFIRTVFPEGWRKNFLGKLFEKGLQAVVVVAHRMCFAN